MRMCRIALALPSRTKTQMERFEAEDGALFTPLPASYPLRIPTRLADRTRFPFSHTKFSSSLTRLETPGYVATRRKRAKRIPFFRSNTLSTLSLRTFSGLEPTPPECLIDETVRSLRTMLMPPEDTKKQLPKRLSRQIQSLRDKFDSVGEESCLAAETDADAVRSFIVSVRNPTKEPSSFKETKTGKIMAALLIGSIQNMPLENIGNADPTSPVSSSNERSIYEENKLGCEEETPLDAKEEAVVGGDVKVEEPLGHDASSSIGETEMSSFDEDNSSPDGDSSEDNTSYNILRDSRYSLDGNDSDRTTEDSPGSRRGTSRSNAGSSCTDSTLQVDSDTTYRMSSDPKLTESVGLRNDEIPIITVDAHESTDSDASRLLPSDENPSPDVLTSRDLMDTNVLVPRASHLTVGTGDVKDARQSFDALAKSGQRLSLKAEEDERRGGSSNATSGSDGSSHERTHRVHLTRHQRDVCRTRSLSARRKRRSPSETENRTNDSSAADSSWKTMADVVGSSHEEMRARATVERQRSMLDLIQLIDTKMMAPERATTRHDKRTVLLRSKRKEREIPTLLEKSSSRDASMRRHHGYHEKDVSFRVPRVRSTPDCVSSGQRPIASSRPTSRSCDSSFLNLTGHHRHYHHHYHRYRHHRHHHYHRHFHNHTRISLSSKRTAIGAPSVAIDRRSDVASEISRSAENRGETGVVASPDVHDDGARSKPTAANTNRPAAAAIRKCSSVCNLGETCYIDTRTEPTNTANMTDNSCVSRPPPDLRQQDEAASSVSPSYPLPAVPSVAAKVSQSPATRTLANVPLHRRSSDSDLSVTPKGGFPLFRDERSNERVGDWIRETGVSWPKE